MPQKISYKQLLPKLGVATLKIEQKQIITAVLNGKDTLCILPTGFGKSLCYVLPHMLTKRNVVIVSPLVSLIRDQEQKYMNVCNTFVIQGNRIAFNGENGIDVSDDIQKGKKTALIFITPEKLLYKKDWISSLDILTIAIDECHCITEWANFRKGYQELSSIVTWFIERPPLISLTATATSSTVNTISQFFKLNNPLLIRVSAIRDDLYLIVEQKDGIAKDLKYMGDIAKGKTIIYCKTRKDTEKVADRLRCPGGVAHYHAGMTNKERLETQDGFASGKYRVIVATIAFGMGIDQPDISTIIHYGMPKDIESYCQEIGRAARSPDIQGTCYLLWGKSDFIVNKTFINNIYDPQEKAYQQKKSYALNRYINNISACRMAFIEHYFDPESKPQKCMKCDICTGYKRKSVPIPGTIFLNI
jgi:ATP-dependent DNA helicase RecQ